ncbi:SpoIIE family protein phosphatase [Thermomonas sp.]|uniref:SpoIIE family protein phosphatase n=1 Tax=Thermomonas sp. TaxID=1971895 RepID=UPI001B5CFB08|nr:SpoIIE family protein phosphatase [Thermomonas sp.]MBK6416956.1 SpoIIE family protein phosphatase [Thermomonas sp.]MBK6924189.1 SpoIIE family protein phosphatase [Thermomonas sp.]MBK7204757.1 SpoIIE family protein phosphatase [Thermomonas sp.]MBK9670297.1 SpoIIE family protein phosphatase [Thermomonas sp.]MBL0227190.1 SpoIIE family protein phosphatase [Thermomonas sp.]
MDATPVQAAEPGLQADAGVPWHASLRTRLMLWVGLLLALLLLAAIATAFYAARSRIVADAEARTRFEAQQAADRLDATMRSVRISGESLIDLGNRVELGREQLLAAMEAMLDANPGTVGGLVALEPGVLADRGRLAYYVGIAARGVPDRDLLADGYDLVGREWYQRTLQATSPWWSEPYFSETAGGRYMTTLNLPLRNREAKRIGMVSLDVPVQALSSSLESLRSLGQRTALFAPAGTIAVHPEKGVAFAHTLSGYIQRAGRGDLAPMEAARAQGRALQFTHADARSGTTRFSVLQPVGDSGWSLQLSLGRDAMLADLEQATRMLGLIGALVALLAALAVLRLARRITVPLTELTASAGHFANGEFDWPVPHDARGDEVGVMARALERARDSIRLQLDQIGRYAAEQQKLQSELDIARNIQRSMLPRDRDFADGSRRYRLQARLEPAKAVGGDFHGHFLHGDGQLWFVVGDVSDKGVPAALFMVRALTVLEVATAAGDAPDRVLADAARHLAEGNDACMFATVLCGVLDLASGGLAIASAGHDAPLLRHADGRIEAIVLESGPALGFEAGDDYQVWHGRLQPGDLLFAWTDGVTEALDRDDRAFGEERLGAALQVAQDAADACDGLLRAVHGFADGAPQSDDITVFAIDCASAPVAGGWPRHLRVPDQRDRLPGLQQALASTLGEAGIEPRRIHDAQVIVEELVCNLMDHGAAAGVDALVLAVAVDAGRVVLDIRDNGAAYDPLAHPPPDLEADIAQRPIGGLGIHLVRELSQDVQYRRQDGWNALRVVLDAILPPS